MTNSNQSTCKGCKTTQKKNNNQCREKIDYLENPHKIPRRKKAPDVFFGY